MARTSKVARVARSMATTVLREALDHLTPEERMQFLRDATDDMCVTVLGCGASQHTGEDCECPDTMIEHEASALGARGGKARARALTPARRREIAKAGAQARWSKKRDN